MLLILLLACNGPTIDSAEPELECARDCLDSPYHRCGAYRQQAESMSCQALAVGVGISDWTAYSLTLDGEAVPSARVGGTLTADCDGSAILEVWSVDEDEPGCSMVEAIPQSCAALAAGLAWDSDVTGWLVEAVTADGDIAVTDAYTTHNRLYATCPKGATTARVVGVLPDLGDIGAEDYWK